VEEESCSSRPREDNHNQVREPPAALIDNNDADLLDILVRLFVVGVAVEASVAERALGLKPMAAMVRLGMIGKCPTHAGHPADDQSDSRDGDDCGGTSWVMPLLSVTPLDIPMAPSKEPLPLSSSFAGDFDDGIADDEGAGKPVVAKELKQKAAQKQKKRSLWIATDMAPPNSVSLKEEVVDSAPCLI
jgi:hypothetical protein